MRRFSLDKSAPGMFETAHGRYVRHEDAEAAIEVVRATPAPINMILHCPKCHVQHIDAPETCWTNPPHRSHLCHACGCIWRPADIPTNGVERITTVGKDDNYDGHAQDQQRPGASEELAVAPSGAHPQDAGGPMDSGAS